MGQEVDLPHNWKQADFQGKDAWYVAQLQLNVPPNRLWGIYLPSIGANAAVYVNGRFLGAGGSMLDRPARNFFRPLYFVIPNGMLKPEVNEIVVHVATDPPGRGFLGPLLMGPDELVSPMYERAFFIRVTLVQFIAVSILVTMFYVGVLAFKTRDPVYFYFTSMLAAVALFDASLLYTAAPLPGLMMDWLRNMGTGWMVVFLVLFLHRFIGVQRPRVEWAILIWALSGSILLATLPPHIYFPVSGYFWDVLTIVWGIYALLTAFWATWQSRSKEYWAIALAVLVMLGAGVRDWIHYADEPEGFSGMLLIYAAAFLLVIFAWVLLYRFISALFEADRLNRELEARVRSKEQELALNYQRMNEVEKQQALADERDRIMRDMHDGIGGQLVTAIAAARTEADEELVDNLETALADLRLMIDSFEPVDDDLGTVLGLIRMRLEKRLHHHGLRFIWQVEDVPRVPDFGPHKVLHVMRIVEEAVTNVVKHAGANHITVAAGETERDGITGVLVQVTDDGKGIDPAAIKGCGLNNMARRAETVGGDFSVFSNSSGTTIQLWLPVEAT